MTYRKVVFWICIFVTTCWGISCMLSKVYEVLTWKAHLIIDDALSTLTKPSVASYVEDPVFRSWARDRLLWGFRGVPDLSQASTEILVPLIRFHPRGVHYSLVIVPRKQESSVGIVIYATAGQPRNRGSIPGRDKALFSTTLSLGVKLPVRETDLSFPNAEATNRWRCAVECQSFKPSIIRTTAGKNKITL